MLASARKLKIVTILLGLCFTATGQYRSYPIAPTSTINVSRLPKQIGLSGYFGFRAQFRNDTATFIIRRARLSAMARPVPAVGIRVQAEFSSLARLRQTGVAAVELTDAYVQFEPGADSVFAKKDWIRRINPLVTFGQFPPPYALEALTPFSRLQSVDRTQTTLRLSYNRDPGILIQISPLNRVILAAGYFNGGGPNVPLNADKQLLKVYRLTVLPLKFWGVSANTSKQFNNKSWGFDSRVLVKNITIELESLYTQTSIAGSKQKAKGTYALLSYKIGPILPLAKFEVFDNNTSLRGTQKIYTGGVNLITKNENVRLQVNFNHSIDTEDHSANEVLTQIVVLF